MAQAARTVAACLLSLRCGYRAIFQLNNPKSMVLYNSADSYDVAHVHFSYSGNIIFVRNFALNIAKQSARPKKYIKRPSENYILRYSCDWHF